MLLDATAQLIDHRLGEAAAEQEDQRADQEFAQEDQDNQGKVLVGETKLILETKSNYCHLSLSLTTINRKRDSNQEPQHPKKATTKLITPTAISRESALSAAWSGRRVAYPSWDKRSHSPMPRNAQPHSQKMRLIQQKARRMNV